jgi:hypothetical protein
MSDEFSNLFYMTVTLSRYFRVFQFTEHVIKIVSEWCFTSFATWDSVCD